MRYYIHFLVFIFLSCGPTKQEKKITSNPSSISEDLIEKAGPKYKIYYDEKEVNLEEVEYNEIINQAKSIKLVVNSCKEIKADYMNYMMKSYQTVTLEEELIEPMFDAEHIGQFIVWQYVNRKTDCLSSIFGSIDKIFLHGDSEAVFLAKYGIMESMIQESRKLDVNYNTAYLPFFSEDLTKRFFDFLYTEIESGSS
ncbi:hypothetical protein [Ekhidna sp.]|uniref:hypothetical protein n=1 Tax=Ekhidna sp. TaxID=2608089 RepID=UPI00329938F1